MIHRPPFYFRFVFAHVTRGTVGAVAVHVGCVEILSAGRSSQFKL